MTKPTLSKNFYRPDELARALNVDRRTIYRRIKKEQIAHIQIGRIIKIPKDVYLKIVREGLLTSR